MTNLVLAALLVLRLSHTALAAGSSLHRRLADQGAGADPAAPRCPPLDRDAFARRARDNTVMFAVMNGEQFDFARNWLHHVKKAGIDYYVAVAADAAASAQLAELGEPCVDRADEDVAKLGLQWGQEGWRRMTWSKVFVLDAVVDYGFNLVVSDIDVVWFRDPLPLFARHSDADLLFSEDGGFSRNAPGDDGLEEGGNPHHNFNTGVYLMRHSERTVAWARAWKASFDECKGHDQDCAYQLMRTRVVDPHPSTPRLSGAFNNSLWMGILPPSMSMTGHTYFLQRLHEVKRVQPYAVHMTWTYNGVPGKRARLRDMGLWVADPPEYYSQGSFLTVDLQLPEPPVDYNAWNENEDMISFHLDSIRSQLQQAYVGMALAAAAGRAFILPQFQCYCEKIWYSVVRCRVVDAQDFPLPVPCPQDYLFDPGHYADAPDAHGPPLDVRESVFLQREEVPEQVKTSVLTIRPSAELSCSHCVKELPGQDNGGSGSGPLLLVPPGLTDAALLRLLRDRYGRYRVWRLSFAGVGAFRRAFGGFANGTQAKEFDKRMAHINTFFCCRREEEVGRYHKEQEVKVPLSMFPDFNYSSAAAA